jgi:Mrr N-terminal domain
MAPLIQVSDATYQRLLAKAQSFEDTAEDVIVRLVERPGEVDEEDEGNSRPRQRRSRRASPGSILPEREYWVPILSILDRAGGAMPANDVIEEVGRRLHDRLSRRDFEELHMGEVRWRNRTRFARLRMKERGLLNEAAPRGLWEMTDAGRRYLAAHGD